MYREASDVAGGGKLPASHVVPRTDVDREAVRAELERTRKERHAELEREERERLQKVIDLRAERKRREREERERERKHWQALQTQARNERRREPLTAAMREAIIAMHEGRPGKPEEPGDLKRFLDAKGSGDEFRSNLLELEHGRDALDLIVRCCLGKVGTAAQSRAAARMLRRTLERDRASELCSVACWLFRRHHAKPLVLPLALGASK